MSRRTRERVSGNEGHNGGIKVGVPSKIENNRGAANILIAFYGICILKGKYRGEKMELGIHHLEALNQNVSGSMNLVLDGHKGL